VTRFLTLIVFIEAFLLWPGCATTRQSGLGAKNKTELFAYGDHGVALTVPFGWRRVRSDSPIIVSDRRDNNRSLKEACGLLINGQTRARVFVLCGIPKNLTAWQAGRAYAGLKGREEQWVLNEDSHQGDDSIASFTGLYVEMREQPKHKEASGITVTPPPKEALVAVKVAVLRYLDSPNAVFILEGRWDMEADAEMTKAFDALVASAAYAPIALMSN